MTCKELGWYFEDHLRDAEVRSARGAVVEHIATCPDCSRFVAQQRDLGKNLRLVRESAPSLSESVDALVVQGYRLYVAEKQQKRGKAFTYPFGIAPVLAWSAIAAAVLLGISFWMFSAREAGRTPAATAHLPTTVPSPQVVVQDRPPTVAMAAGQKHAVRLRSHSERHPAFTPVRVARSLPDGFRNLMYCDALSCPEAMDMIRVQLPTAVVPGQLSGFMRTSGSVTADVLVGPDGIARGIRFEEIEF